MDDFKFVISLLTGFFRQTHIQKNLKVLCESSFISKWEMWWQTELAIYIHSNNLVSKEEITSEETFLTNSRSNKDRVRIDLIINETPNRRF